MGDSRPSRQPAASPAHIGKVAAEAADYALSWRQSERGGRGRGIRCEQKSCKPERNCGFMHGRLFSVRRMMCVNAVLAQANASMSRAPPSWVGVGTWRLSGAFCGPSGYDWTKEGPERHGPH
jgi:hypothetical protein